MSWTLLLPDASPERTLERARSALGRKTVYKLGQGGMNARIPLTQKCDCSGFVAWSIGIPRQVPPGSGGWLDTDNYWNGGRSVRLGIFDAVERKAARPGDLYVYPDHGGRQGHIGIITDTAGGAPSRLIHCSSGNWRSHGDAIQITGCTLFDNHGAARVVRVDYPALRELAGVTPAARSPLPTILQHPLLRADTVLRRVAVGELLLRATGTAVPGCGAIHQALNRLAQRYPDYAVELGAGAKFLGNFGPKTKRALENFQRDHEIEVDGVVGRFTVRALDAALRSLDEFGEDRTREGHGTEA